MVEPNLNPEDLLTKHKLVSIINEETQWKMKRYEEQPSPPDQESPLILDITHLDTDEGEEKVRKHKL